MNKRKNKKKIDIEAKLFMYLLHLKEETNKNYSVEECEKNIAYLFDNYDEFKNYFESNGFHDISADLLETCRMKTTKKGTIIALKGLCDHAIRSHNSMCSHNIDSSSDEKQKFDVLAIPCDRAFVVSQEKVEKFKNIKPDPAIRQQMEEIVEKIRVNNLTEVDKKKDILFQDYPPLRITEETRQAVLEHPEIHSELSVRARMGKFYTDEEWEQRREDVLSTPLPGGEEKGSRLVKKRITPKNNK